MRSSPSAWPASAVAGAADASDSTAATARGLVAEREKQQNFISVCYLQPKKKSGTDLFYTRSSAISSRHHPASAGAMGRATSGAHLADVRSANLSEARPLLTH